MKTMTSVLSFSTFDITDQALADERQLLLTVEAILADDDRNTSVTDDGDEPNQLEPEDL